MADFLFTFAVEEILKKVGSAATAWIGRAWGLRGDLEKLSGSTNRIRELLQDAAGKQSGDERVMPWLVKLQDLAYDAEDVFDEFTYWTLQRQVRGKVRNFVSPRSNLFVFPLNMASKVKNINESLAEIERQATTELKLRAITGTDGNRVAHRVILDRQTDPFLGRSEVPIGRSNDVDKIISMLISSSNDERPLTVVPILGMAGLGKTTLAKLVLNAAKEEKHFDVTIWICVSDDFDYKKILEQMLVRLGKGREGGDVGYNVELLQKELENNKFLLVLDDVWDDKGSEWGCLASRLEKICQKNGSVIVVTTRSTDVAIKMETNSQYRFELEQLSDEDCWSIIKEEVLGSGEEPITSELETIGKEIARKCKGVPLAAKVVGGTLHSLKEKEEWMSINDSDVWSSVIGDSEILPILKLSFDHLPSCIKPCFAYCSLFPKDFEFEMESLIQIWMAEGFIELPPSDGNEEMTMEDVGNEFVNKLIANSFLQDVERNEYGDIRSFKMHDLVHDLAMYISPLGTLIVKGRIIWLAKIKSSVFFA